MPHAELVEHSTHMAKAVGDAYGHLHAVRSSGLKGPAAVALTKLDAALARISDRNAAMGEVAHGLLDDAPIETKDAGSLSASKKASV